MHISNSKYSMYTCFYCGKQIEEKVTEIVPSLFQKQLGDFSKSYHPSCYKTAEQKAKKEITHYEK